LVIFAFNALTMPPAVILFMLAAIFLGPIGYRAYVKSLRNKQVKRVYDEKQVVYDNILQQYFPYYKNLSTALRERFLKRTLTFMSVKEFKFVELGEEEHMSLLISASAVQLTFGIDQYLLDYFKTIYVMRSTYHYGLFNVPFEGHVNGQGIYLSWNNFMKAYADYSDGDNVGLHEMAHALSYVNFTVDDGADEEFKQRFRQFSKTGRPTFARVKDGEISFLGNYAGTNYEEFWAVCVEHFFEQPAVFKEQLPELYNAMCRLLNQDLLTPGIFLVPMEDA
jgi:Mlc titration factor MtfA (ptsG expression regulator)